VSQAGYGSVLLSQAPAQLSGPETMYRLDPSLTDPEPVTQTLSCELNLIETLANCVFFSNIHTLLHLFATLPVTTATNERSFSTFQRLLAYLRSTMGQKQARN